MPQRRQADARATSYNRPAECTECLHLRVPQSRTAAENWYLQGKNGGGFTYHVGLTLTPFHAINR